MSDVLKKTVIFSSLLFLTAIFAGGWYFTSIVLHLPITECDQKHYVFCGSPDEQGLSYEDTNFTTKDGFQIPGWYMPAENSSKAVILVHGRGANRTEGMRYASALINAGFNVLTIDMRHPRQSPEIISTMGFHEQKDVIAAVDFLEQQKKINDIGVMGFSMGGATSVLAMANDQRIKAGVFNSAIANVEDVLSEGGQRLYGLPKYPLIPVVMQMFSWRGDIDLDRLHAEDLIAEIAPRPIYIMHGTADKTVDYHHGTDLYQRAKEPKQFWKVDNGEHTQLWQADREKAESSVVTFFQKNL